LESLKIRRTEWRSILGYSPQRMRISRKNEYWPWKAWEKLFFKKFWTNTLIGIWEDKYLEERELGRILGRYDLDVLD
jgi:hypothetical protein